MAISEGAGTPGPPQSANTGGTKASRSDKGYGSSSAGFSLKSTKMDGVPARSTQVNKGKGKAPSPVVKAS